MEINTTFIKVVSIPGISSYSSRSLIHSYDEMFRRERDLPLRDRMDFVYIAAPVNLRFQIACCALDVWMNDDDE